MDHQAANGNHGSDDEVNEDMIEVIYDDDIQFDGFDDDGNDGTDQGDMADIEDEGDETDSADDGSESFAGEKPDFILKGHQDAAIFCCSFDSAGEKLLTGGEDDIANLWDSSSIESKFPIFKCRGHKDSVISVGFSFDTSYFYSADISGVVKVWKTSDLKATTQPILSLETGDLTWSFWHFGSNVLFAGCEDGSTFMWKVPSGDCKIFPGDGSKCECATLLPDGKRLVIGYESGAVKQFDLKSGQVQHTLHTPGQRSCAILSIDSSKTHQIVASGDFRGRVSIYNTQTGKHLGNLQCGTGITGSSIEDEGNADSVESVAFCPDNNFEYVAAGSVSGHIAMWDVTSMGERGRLQLDAGVTKLLWHPTKPMLCVGGLDGVLRIIDARTCKIERQLGRHRSEILDLSISRDGTKLVSASEDGSIYIFKLDK